MSGVEVAVPVALTCAKLFRDACINVLDAGNDAEAFLMIEANIKDDIDDAYIFLRRLKRYVGKEEKLKERAQHAIHRTEEAMKVFHERLARAGKGGSLTWIFEDRRAARSLLRPLELAQSNLSRRIDWMRSALDRLANSPKEEGELPSSMSLQVPAMVIK